MARCAGGVGPGERHPARSTEPRRCIRAFQRERRARRKGPREGSSRMSDQPARRAPASLPPNSPSKKSSSSLSPSSSSSSSFLSCENLTRKFGTFVAVDHVSFEVPRGKVFGFLGPNGSGKSTAIRMLTGLLRPSEGSAKMRPDGRTLDVTRDTDTWKTHLGYMSQKFSLYLDLTAEENLAFF